MSYYDIPLFFRNIWASHYSSGFHYEEIVPVYFMQRLFLEN